MNPQAEALNTVIQEKSSTVFELLSEKGKVIFFPKKERTISDSIFAEWIAIAIPFPHSGVIIPAASPDMTMC